MKVLSLFRRAAPPPVVEERREAVEKDGGKAARAPEPVFQGSPVPRLLERLSPEQGEAVTTPHGKVMVVAGPGSGKTRILATRAAYMVESFGVSPEEILMVTFTRKAAEEMRERLQALLGAKAQGIRVATFHAYALELLRASGREVVLLKEEEGLELYRRAWLSVYKRPPSPQELQGLVGALERKLGGEEPLPAREREVFDAYTLLKRQEGKYDFDDLLREDLDWRRARGHVLVDEYQDINWPNLRFLKRFARTVFAVGDPRQSIYGWRGSAPELAERFEEFFPGGVVYVLGTNFRSPAVLVERADGFLRSALPEKGYPPLRASREGGEVHFRATASPEEDVEAAAEVVEELLKRNSPQDVAVLFRSRTLNGFPLEKRLLEALGARGVPVGRGVPLSKGRVFAFVRALVNYAMDPEAPALVKGLLPFLPPDLRELLGRGRLLDEELALTPRGQAVQLLYGLLWGGREGTADFSDLLLKALGAERDPELLAQAKAIAKVWAEEGHGDPYNLGYVLEDRAPGIYPEGVALLTAHQAKGLEWPTVVVVGVREGGFPSRTSPYEEEARVLFVALTRAREALWLVGSPTSPFGRLLQ